MLRKSCGHCWFSLLNLITLTERVYQPNSKPGESVSDSAEHIERPQRAFWISCPMQRFKPAKKQTTSHQYLVQIC